MKNNPWVKYQNGNYMVSINTKNGTKIRENDLDFFKADFPESFDCKITNNCNMGCRQCHENSTPDGLHGDIMNLKFFDTLHPYTEIAIGGGNPLAHPDLIPFLKKCKSLNLIPSMTVNQYHFMKNLPLIHQLVDDKLIYGLGVSLYNAFGSFIEEVSRFPNAVIHVIAGITSTDQIKELSKHNLKILILGYKKFGRGVDNYNAEQFVVDSKIQDLYDLLPIMRYENWFNVISFDNLAIKQLNPKRLLSEDEWNEFYMGDDGSATMYVDCVKQEFAQSSTSTERYPIMDNIVDMFNVIRV